jgi:hypothetical protein
MEIKDVLERLTSRKASEEAIREIIEYHVTAALQAASENAEKEDIGMPDRDGTWKPYYIINEKSILDAYPPNLIK